MIDWQVRHTVCGLQDLSDHKGSGVTHLLSILDPEAPDPTQFVYYPALERLTLRFHDIILAHPDYVLPRRSDVAELLAFGRGLPQADTTHLLIHCHMGISRSTAATSALILQAQPELNEDDVLAYIQSLRPQAWPNSLMIRHADALLNRGGRLVAALGRLYRRQLQANPRFAEPLRTGGRLAEVEMAEAAGE
jgi:predicted protein tyrosine phosphatase